MPTVSEETLRATGLREQFLATYRLAGRCDLSPPEREKLAKKLGVGESTVRRHLSRVRMALEGSTPISPVAPGDAHLLEVTDPEKHAEALSQLSTPFRNIAEVAEKVGISPTLARKLAKDLDGELQPLKREIEEIRLDDLTNRFGTLTRDSIDAITPEKLRRAGAKDLAIIAGIGVQNWQLLRGQPTSRAEISDRREMNEIVELLVKEAARRGIEIDVTPEGGVTPKKSPFRNAKHQREVKQITSGDPAETLVPA